MPLNMQRISHNRIQPDRIKKGNPLLTVLTGKDTSRVGVIKFVSPGSVRTRTGKKSLAKLSEGGNVIRKCDETRGHKFYLPNSKTVIITKHISIVDSTLEGANGDRNLKGPSKGFDRCRRESS